MFGATDGASGPRASLASGYHIAGDTLVAYSLTGVDEDPSHPENTLLARTSGDGETWGAPQPIAQGFFLGGPQRLPGGRLLLGGRWPTGHPRVLYSDSSDGIRGWQDAALPRTAAFAGAYPEPSWFRRDDGTLVMLLRTRVGRGWLHASTSADGGRTWSRPEPTDFPDATARTAAGNLPDGSAFVISNPSRRFGRMPLTVALSSDGRRFDRALVIRGGETKPRFPGRSKWPGWQYPSAVVWNDQLFVAYSINKEDIGVTRIPLSDLLRGSERQGTH